MPSKFFHKFWSSNLRFFLLLGPCGVITLTIGGHAVAITAVIGLLVAYLLDALGLDFMGYLSLWFTVIASIIAVCAVWPRSSNLPLVDMFILLNFTSSILLLGLWGSLQSIFFIKNFPDLNALFERALSGCLALPCTGVLMIGGLPFCGTERAAYFLCLLLFIALKTSFSPKDDTPETPQSRRKEKPKDLSLPQFADPFSEWVFGVHLVAFQFLPMAFHFFLHRKATHVFFGQDLILLFCLPLLLIHFGWDEIWDYRPFNLLKEARVYLASIVGAIAVGAIEYRIVTSTLAPYLYYHLSRPWLSWILVTVALYAAGAGLFLFRGFSQKGDHAVAFQGCVYITSLSAALSLGIPWYLLPLPALAAYAFLRFLMRFELIPYIAFVCVSMLVMTWFAYRSFWFLDVSFGPLSLRLFALILVLLGGVFLLAPGTLILRQKDLSDVAFLAMAVGLSLVEFVLFQQNSEHDTDVYPSLLIWFTTVVGVAVAAKVRGLLRGFIRWLVIAILVSKCAISFTPHPSELAGFFLLVIQGGSLRTQLRPPIASVHLAVIFCGLYLTRRILLSNILDLVMDVPSDVDLGVGFPGLGTLLVGLFVSNGPFRSLLGVLGAALSLLVIQTSPLFTMFGNPELIWALGGIAAVAWLCFRRYPALSFLLFGACAGLVVCELSVPTHGLVYGWYVLVFTLFTGVFILLRSASEGIPLLLSYAGCVLILPVAFLDLNWMHGSGKQNKDALYAAQVTLIGTLASLHFLISLYVKLSPLTDTAILVGNSAAVMSLLLGLLLRWGYQGGNELCVVVLSPVLLLLSHGYNRYYPLWVATTTFLAFVSASAILALPFSEQSIELFCLLGCLPIVIHSTISHAAQDSDFWLVCLTPLCLLGLFLTSLWSTRWLALGGVGSVPVVWYLSQSIRRKGMNIL